MDPTGSHIAITSSGWSWWGVSATTSQMTASHPNTQTPVTSAGSSLSNVGPQIRSWSIISSVQQSLIWSSIRSNHCMNQRTYGRSWRNCLRGSRGVWWWTWEKSFRTHIVGKTTIYAFISKHLLTCAKGSHCSDKQSAMPSTSQSSLAPYPPATTLLLTLLQLV